MSTAHRRSPRHTAAAYISLLPDKRGKFLSARAKELGVSRCAAFSSAQLPHTCVAAPPPLRRSTATRPQPAVQFSSCPPEHQAASVADTPSTWCKPFAATPGTGNPVCPAPALRRHGRVQRTGFRTTGARRGGHDAGRRRRPPRAMHGGRHRRRVHRRRRLPDGGPPASSAGRCGRDCRGDGQPRRPPHDRRVPSVAGCRAGGPGIPGGRARAATLCALWAGGPLRPRASCPRPRERGQSAGAPPSVTLPISLCPQSPAATDMDRRRHRRCS